MQLKDKIALIQDFDAKQIIEGASHNGTPLLKLVFNVYEEVFAMPCQNCSGKLKGYIKKIQNINLNSEIMSNKEREYRMKSGSVIHRKGTNEYYSDNNITDEIAEKLLKENLNRQALFAKMPKGAIARLEKERKSDDTKAAEEAEKQKQAELEAKKKEEEAAKAAEEAEKQAFETAKEAGDLDAKQLDSLTVAEIKAYADAHKYEYDSRAVKDELTKQVAEKKVVNDKE